VLYWWGRRYSGASTKEAENGFRRRRMSVIWIATPLSGNPNKKNLAVLAFFSLCVLRVSSEAGGEIEALFEKNA